MIDWNMIRDVYFENHKDIMKYGQRGQYGLDPYFIDWNAIFTPIEDITWGDIRTSGLVMYPQYPVGNVFIDFANPSMKVGIEVDGKDFHNKKDDYIRDEKLASKGWKIFRITGKECHNKAEYPFDMQPDKERFKACLYDWVMNSSEGVIYSVCNVFDNGFSSSRKRSMCEKSLEAHSNFWKAP